MDATRLSLARVLELGTRVTWFQAGAVAYEAVLQARRAGGAHTEPQWLSSCHLTRGGDVLLEDDAAHAAPEAVVGLLRHLLTACDDPDRLGIAVETGHVLTFLDEFGERVTPKRRRVEIAALALRGLAAEADRALARGVDGTEDDEGLEEAGSNTIPERPPSLRLAPDTSGRPQPGDANRSRDDAPGAETRSAPLTRQALRDYEEAATRRRGLTERRSSASGTRDTNRPAGAGSGRARRRAWAAALTTGAVVAGLGVWLWPDVSTARRRPAGAPVLASAGSPPPSRPLQPPRDEPDTPPAPAVAAQVRVTQPEIAAPSPEGSPPRPPVVSSAPAPPPTPPLPPTFTPPSASSGGGQTVETDDPIFSWVSPGVVPPDLQSRVPSGTIVLAPGDEASGPYLEVLVNRGGAVQDVRLRGRPPDNANARYQAALAAARSWRFAPAELNGHAVRYVVRVVLGRL